MKSSLLLDNILDLFLIRVLVAIKVIISRDEDIRDRDKIILRGMDRVLIAIIIFSGNKRKRLLY